MNASDILRKLLLKKVLTLSEAQEFMEGLVTGKYTPTQAAGMLVALAAKSIMPAELLTFVETAKQYEVPLRMDIPSLLDTCGTGGDGSHTFNISTASALVLAAGGVPVAKHGNRAVSSSCGSADVLEALGIATQLDAKQAEIFLKTNHWVFLFAPLYHPAFKNLSGVRKELGIRTVFNMMGPLLNPAPLSSQIIGVYDPALTELYAEVLKMRGMRNAMVVHGFGMDEIALHASTKITILDEGKIHTFFLNPEDAGLQKAPLEDLRGGSSYENAQIISDLFLGKKSAKRDAVLLNAAAGFMLAGKASNFRQGVACAVQVIDSGVAMQKLKELQEASHVLTANN
ncbi:anthranilate phosphoribosyltransferase [Candidatus Woesearchaeota archaeon]|nr:anthranilate phosphoribosyltransferase [Candidatus Woesearchaeota archaeon]